MEWFMPHESRAASAIVCVIYIIGKRCEEKSECATITMLDSGRETV